MTAYNFVQFAQFSTTLIGFLGIAVALRSHRRQMNAQMFIEFSSRFERVLRKMPAQAFLRDRDVPLPPPSEELTKRSLQCFHFVSDLYHLHKGGYVTKDLWHPWQLGIRQTLQNPLLQREWFAIENVFVHMPDYRAYIRGMIHAGDKRGRRPAESSSS